MGWHLLHLEKLQSPPHIFGVKVNLLEVVAVPKECEVGSGSLRYVLRAWGVENTQENPGHKRLRLEERVALLLATQVLTPVACSQHPSPVQKHTMGSQKSHASCTKPCLFCLTLAHLRCQLSVSRPRVTRLPPSFCGYLGRLQPETDRTDHTWPGLRDSVAPV